MAQAENAASAQVINTLVGDAKEYLTFKLGSEEYGIDILKVQEIRGYDHVTPIANSPEFLKGVINLRGTIAPIVDMREQFERKTPLTAEDHARARAFIEGKMEMIRRDPHMTDEEKAAAIAELNSKL